jgi:hypothetical protein
VLCALEACLCCSICFTPQRNRGSCIVCQSHSGYLAWFARRLSPAYLDPSCTKAVVAYNCTYFSDSVVGWPAKTDTRSNQIVIGNLHQANICKSV